MKILYKLNDNVESVTETANLISIYIDRNRAKIAGKTKEGNIVDIYYPYIKVHGNYYSPKGIIPENAVFADLENQLNFLCENSFQAMLVLKYVH